MRHWYWKQVDSMRQLPIGSPRCWASASSRVNRTARSLSERNSLLRSAVGKKCANCMKKMLSFQVLLFVSLGAFAQESSTQQNADGSTTVFEQKVDGRFLRSKTLSRDGSLKF